RSGTASIGKRSAEETPRPAIRSVATITRNRFFSDDSMMALSMDRSRFDGLSVFLGLVLEDQLALEKEGAHGDDRLPPGEPALDQLAIARRATELDRAEPVRVAVFPILGGKEDALLVLDLDDGGSGDGEVFVAPGACKHDPDEHPELEHVVGIGRLRQD